MLEERLEKHIELLIKRYPELDGIKENLIKAYLLLEQCIENGGKILIAGNGGSAADAEHIVGELMKSFKKARRLSKQECEELIKVNEEYGKVLAEKLQGAIPAIALDGHI